MNLKPSAMAVAVNARNKQKHEKKKLRERERGGGGHCHVFLATKNRVSAITALQISRSNFQRRRVS